MNCETCRNRLGEFLEGTLPDAVRAQVKAHLSDCTECNAFRERLRKLDDLLGQIPAEEAVPPALTEKILACHRPHRLIPRPLLLATAAAVLITAVLAWYLTLPSPRPPGIIPEGPEPRTVTARLYMNRMVGKVLPGASYRIYSPGIGTVFYNLTLLGIDPALSWNNLHLSLNSPFEEVTADEEGRLRLKKPLGTGPHLVSVRKAGHLDAWGLIESSSEIPDKEVVLYPARTLKGNGTVLDQETNRPIMGALITTPDGTGMAFTDEEGRFAAEIRVLPGLRPRLYVFAKGYAETRKRMSLKACRAGAFDHEARLEKTRRLDARLCLTDPTGAPVENAMVLAYPDLGDSRRIWLPPLRLKRPEIGLTDRHGRVVLGQLLDCRYRLKINHARFTHASPTYIQPGESEEVPIAVKPAGDGRLSISVTGEDGEPLERVHVLLVRIRMKKGSAIPHRFLETVTDFEGNAVFRGLAPGAATLQIHTPEGLGHYITFLLDRGDITSFPHTLPPRLHTLTGTLSPEVRGTIRMVRIQGDRPRIQVGRNKSTAHRIAVETPVLEDGTFSFPPLPALRKAQILGRLTANPKAQPVVLRCMPPLNTILISGDAGVKPIEVFWQK